MINILKLLESENENKSRAIRDLENMKENEINKKEYQYSEFRVEYENLKRRLGTREMEIVDLKKSNKEILEKHDDLIDLFNTLKDEKVIFKIYL